MKAIAQIKTTGEIIDLKGHDCSLEQAQAYVQTGTDRALIEFVQLTEDGGLMIHEEGLLYSLPVNDLASRMAGIHIVGDVLVIENEEKDFE